MPPQPSRRSFRLTALMAATSVLLAACSTDTPNTTLTPHTDLGRDIDGLWDILLARGLVVFVLGAVALLFEIAR